MGVGKMFGSAIIQGLGDFLANKADIEYKTQQRNRWVPFSN